MQTYGLSSNVHLALFYPAINSLLSGNPCIHNIKEVIVQCFIQLRIYNIYIYLDIRGLVHGLKNDW